MRAALPHWFPGVERRSERSHVSGEDVRRTFRSRSAEVAVITACGASGPVGLTVTSLVAVSGDPPRLSFTVSHRSSGWAALSVARHVGINLLDAATAVLAASGWAAGADPFSVPADPVPGPWRVPILDGCVSWMAGGVEKRLAVGDHSVVVVRVLDVGSRIGTGDLPR